jgi:hypothetical protein
VELGLFELRLNQILVEFFIFYSLSIILLLVESVSSERLNDVPDVVILSVANVLTMFDDDFITGDAKIFLVMHQEFGGSGHIILVFVDPEIIIDFDLILERQWVYTVTVCFIFPDLITVP